MNCPVCDALHEVEYSCVPAEEIGINNRITLCSCGYSIHLNDGAIDLIIGADQIDCFRIYGNRKEVRISKGWGQLYEDTSVNLDMDVRKFMYVPYDVLNTLWENKERFKDIDQLRNLI